MEPFIGQIIMFAGTFAPRGWAFCDGQLLDISSNTALFSIVGTVYGGDGRTTFALPDLRGRVPVHPGSGPGLSSYRQGQKGGYEAIGLNQSQLPNYNMTGTGNVAGNVEINVNEEDPSSTEAANMVLGNTENNIIYNGSSADGSLMLGGVSHNLTTTVSVSSGGGGQSHENRMPFNTVQFIIALQGVYPSRN
ncbi:tail fiber protein [Pontibacter sp. G13]|uniref:phage tail protein n=1 Tax=Pontibacter sp. G13 TaxID=3074898 RepID=UPI00288978A0|nr:tail fiber protein [Pontibacter sp. G13]WNJ17818.1 tail fiber protein [Pontibacter sp. G13]